MGSARSSAGGGSADRNSLQEGQAKHGHGISIQGPAALLVTAHPRQRSPKVWVGTIGQLVNALLQGAAGPVNGQVDVLEQHPAAILVGMGQGVHGDGFLQPVKRADVNSWQQLPLTAPQLLQARG